MTRYPPMYRPPRLVLLLSMLIALPEQAPADISIRMDASIRFPVRRHKADFQDGEFLVDLKTAPKRGYR